MARILMTKKTRFEVFKRDSFTCQYCGKSAPEVVLNVDHIIPVSKDGTNEILNLITACFECNSGKSNRTIGDDAVVVKQLAQLKQINERREQIQMIAEWRNQLMSLEDADDLFDIVRSATGIMSFLDGADVYMKELE